MDIRPTELPIKAVLPTEAIRRVERRSDARDYPQREHEGEERPEDGEREAPQDSVDVSPSYRLAHSDPLESDPSSKPVDGSHSDGLPAQLDIEA